MNEWMIILNLSSSQDSNSNTEKSKHTKYKGGYKITAMFGRALRHETAVFMSSWDYFGINGWSSLITYSISANLIYLAAALRIQIIPTKWMREMQYFPR